MLIFNSFYQVRIHQHQSKHVQYLNSQLITTLSYNYGNSNVLPQDENDVLTDPKNGKLYKRQKDMEAIYQNDLMEVIYSRRTSVLIRKPWSYRQSS